MKKAIIFIAVFVIAAICIDTFAQGCPMCKTSLEEARKNGSQVGSSLNNGILYLLALPYLVVATFALIWYKNYRTKKKKALTF